MKKLALAVIFASAFAPLPASAQLCSVGPNGAVYCEQYLNAPVPQPPVGVPYDPYFSPQNPFWLFYTPVCHYSPDVWAWHKECF